MSRREAQRIARRLKDAGHEVVFAGGIVRDRLLGRRGGDVDIATSADPEAVQELFARTVLVGVTMLMSALIGTDIGTDPTSHESGIPSGSMDPKLLAAISAAVKRHRQDRQ